MLKTTTGAIKNNYRGNQEQPQGKSRTTTGEIKNNHRGNQEQPQGKSRRTIQSN
jgi:hypothetical protein